MIRVSIDEAPIELAVELAALEEQWGGTLAERTVRRAAAVHAAAAEAARTA